MEERSRREGIDSAIRSSLLCDQIKFTWLINLFYYLNTNKLVYLTVKKRIWGLIWWRFGVCVFSFSEILSLSIVNFDFAVLRTEVLGHFKWELLGIKVSNSCMFMNDKFWEGQPKI